jgi:hypothetical protein
MNMHVAVAPNFDRASFARWDRTMTVFDAASTKYDHFYATVWTPVSDELERMAPRPSLLFEIEARDGQIAQHFVPATNLHYWDDHISREFRTKAAEIREAWLGHLAAQKELNYDEISDELDRLCEALCASENELLTLPSPDQNALMWKLERLFGPEVRKEDQFSDGWCPEWVNALMADARRLIPHDEVEARDLLDVCAT